MAKYKGSQPAHKFVFTQREINLLVSILFDITTGASLEIDGEFFVPRKKTNKELEHILATLNEVGMTVDNDYLSNFKEVR